MSASENRRFRAAGRTSRSADEVGIRGKLHSTRPGCRVFGERPQDDLGCSRIAGSAAFLPIVSRGPRTYCKARASRQALRARPTIHGCGQSPKKRALMNRLLTPCIGLIAINACLGIHQLMATDKESYCRWEVSGDRASHSDAWLYESNDPRTGAAIAEHLHLRLSPPAPAGDVRNKGRGGDSAPARFPGCCSHAPFGASSAAR